MLKPLVLVWEIHGEGGVVYVGQGGLKMFEMLMCSCFEAREDLEVQFSLCDTKYLFGIHEQYFVCNKLSFY